MFRKTKCLLHHFANTQQLEYLILWQKLKYFASEVKSLRLLNRTKELLEDGLFLIKMQSVISRFKIWNKLFYLFIHIFVYWVYCDIYCYFFGSYPSPNFTPLTLILFYCFSECPVVRDNSILLRGGTRVGCFKDLSSSRLLRGAEVGLKIHPTPDLEEQSRWV